MNSHNAARAAKAMTRRCILGSSRSEHLSAASSSSFSTLRWVSPKNDIWIRRDVARSSNDRHEVGLTSFTLDEITDLGDIDSITKEEGNELHFAWSGLKISDGDELYHCTYENVQGKIIIPLPRNANVTKVLGVGAGGQTTLTPECAICIVEMQGDPEWA